MQIDIVSVFPEYFDVTGPSLLGKAQEKGLVTIKTHNLRDWTHDVHHSVDDTPVGGGAGMVMKPEVRTECLMANLRYPKEILDARYGGTRHQKYRVASTRSGRHRVAWTGTDLMR